MTDLKLIEKTIGSLIRSCIDNQNGIDAMRGALVEAGVVSSEAIDRHYANVSADANRALESEKLLQLLREFSGPTQ